MPALDGPTKVLIGGIFAGVLVFGLGELNTKRRERRVEELQKACVAEKQTEAKNQGTFSALTSIFTAKPTCDPVELASSNGYVGVQGELAAAEQEFIWWDKWAPIAAIAVAVVCSLPWWWYFFLRRIRELREAITGK